MSRARFVENPFYILGVRPSCTRAEMEREGQKLLGMLELGLPVAKKYKTPLGEAERTPEMVRQAMAELRDPNRRLLHELWAQLPADPLPDEPAESVRDPGQAGPGPWPAAPTLLGVEAKK